MAVYLALFRAGFRRQSTYRAALLTGLAANVFFGVFRSAIFISLYDQRGTAGGLDRADALTYVWLLQALFGVIFVGWHWELPESIRSGNYVVDLLRPGHQLGRLLAVDIGRTSFGLLARGLPQLLLGWLLFRILLPSTPWGVLALTASIALCMAAAFELRFLIGSTAFWTADFRGWWNVLFGAIWLGGGFVVPVELFPPALRLVTEHGPLSTLLVLPVRVAAGREVGSALAQQACWVLVGGAVCSLVMRYAERHVTVHGG